ncbi:hypothetical protein D3C80_1384620 [compost metagenome]
MNFHYITNINQENVVRVNAYRFSKKCVLAKHAVLTMNRNKILRTHQIEHQLQFFLTAMSRYVNAGIGTTVDDFCP